MIRQVRVLATFCAVLLSGTLSAQEMYRLTPGDQLETHVVGATAPNLKRIDIDGFLRLPGLVSAKISGLTLTEAETRLQEAMIEADIFVNPKVSLSVEAYAPIYVTGDVNRPGTFDYMTRLTASIAMGLAGGPAIAGVDSVDRALQQAQIEGLMRGHNLNAMQAAARVARIVHQLKHADTATAPLELGAELTALVPSPDAGTIQALLEAESNILAREIARQVELVRLWGEERSEITRQIDLLKQRLDVQRDVVTIRQADLEKARDLRDRGLQTATVFSAAEREEADARAELLAIQSIISQATTSFAQSSRQLAQFSANARLELLARLQRERDKLLEASQGYNTERSKLAVLAGAGSLLTIGTGTQHLSMTIRRNGAVLQATPDTELLPGDGLEITVASDLSVQN